LLRETLRAVANLSASEDLGAVSDRFDTPLLAYRGGLLTRASDSLYAQLAPVGRYLPPAVQIGLGVETEVTMTSRPIVAGMQLLLGFRPVQVSGPRTVLAAPAPFTERVLDRERRDIGVLVLFAASIGALAALGLSGLAARELERPVGALRLAALRIARGERFPAPERAPVKEFVPVFSAFQRMDADLASSRAALEEAQRRTESVLRDVASGVIAVDRDGRVMLANPGADALLGRQVVPGLTLRQLGAAGLAARTEAFLASSMAEDAFDATLGGRQVRGSLASLERGSGGAVLTLEDVTELARAQRVLAWGEMARQVAHEIKNPLTPIRLGVQHLRRARGDNRVDFGRIFEQNVERILAEIDRLDEIARAFSRYGSSPSERLEPVPIDVASITKDVVDLEKMAADSVTWHLDAPTNPVLVLARDDELREVLLNVMENARQAGATRVDVAVTPGPERVEVTVRDNGDGVAPGDLERIFEPRFSTRTSGSGLGLAISRNMVEAWGGRMSVERAPERGTVMRISLAPGDSR
jgi:nitrogen fixation/metabolism regulation signal transduction histidine kinase